MSSNNKRRSRITPSEAREAVLAIAAHETETEAAKSLGITKPALQRRRRKAETWGISAHGEVIASPARALRAGPARYILTAAQSNTHVHEAFWGNLRALADHYGAEIMVGRIRYNHTHQQVAQEKVNRAAQDSLWYDDALDPYFVDDRVQICRGLVWAGDMNIIPTAVDPLSGLDSFTGVEACVFPHPQISLKSVATAPGTPTKMNYTTGAVTLKNYIKRKAGLKAEFHHAFGAILIEVDSDGDFFPRQINATNDGAICDLDVMVEDGKVTTGNRIRVLTPGDLHGTKHDPVAFEAVWGRGGLVDTLRPETQVLHDVLNFGSRSHHNRFFDMVQAHYDRAESVEGELEATAEVINRTLRDFVATIVAKANHDEHLDRWVETADIRADPVNAVFYAKALSVKLGAIRDADDGFDLVAWALAEAGVSEDVRFLSRDEPLIIAGIRHDQHGDLGPNGSRGSVRNIARTGEKSNVGHSHIAGIFHGCYQAGTLSLLDMTYNRGPSAWSHSVIITYENGKRAIITLRGSKWRASASAPGKELAA